GEEIYPQYRPRVFLDTDKERIDITESRLIGNGTKGKVSYRVTSNTYGTFARLQNVLIKEDDFIEYVAQTPDAGGEFGNSKPVKKEEAREEITKARKPRKESEDTEKESDEFGEEEVNEEKPVKETK